MGILEESIPGIDCEPILPPCPDLTDETPTYDLLQIPGLTCHLVLPPCPDSSQIFFEIPGIECELQGRHRPGADLPPCPDLTDETPTYEYLQEKGALSSLPKDCE